MANLLLTQMFLVLVVVLSSTTGVQGDLSWIGTYNWAVVTSLGVNVSFDCVLKDNGTDVLPENATALLGSARWQLVGHSDLKGPYYETENKLVNGDRLEIKNITMADKGIYLCHVDLQCNSMELCGNKTSMWFKHGLNLNGPIYKDLIEKYRVNIITGAISAASVTAVFAFLCLVYKFRNKDQRETSNDIKLNTYTNTDDGAAAQEY